MLNSYLIEVGFIEFIKNKNEKESDKEKRLSNIKFFTDLASSYEDL